MVHRSHRLVLAATLFVFTTGPLLAAHNDSQIEGLRVTVGSVDSTTGNVTITITATGSDSSYFIPSPGAFLGTQFCYDCYDLTETHTLISPAFPAIDWGDGVTVGATRLPYYGTDGTGDPVYRGQFTHTYTTPDVFTIRAFGVNVYGVPTPNYGNAVYDTTWIVHEPGTTTDTFRTDYYMGVSATNTADLTGLVVPALGGKGLAALAFLLAVAGSVLLLWRRG